MKLSETLISSITALTRNKVRSFLTMLGVVIGVFAIVILMAIGEGFQNYVTDQFNSLGSNLIFVVPGKISATQDPATSFTNNKIELRHIKLIETSLPKIKLEITPSVEVMKTVSFKSTKYIASIGASYPNGEKIYDFEMDKGEYFTESDESLGSRVAVLGPEVVKQLFGSRNPMGQSVKIDNASFKVVGVFKSKSPEFDRFIYVPYTTMKNVLDISTISAISVKLMDNNDMDSVKREIEFALLKELSRDDFTVMTQKDILKTIENVLGVLSLGLSAIAAISLLVGGIGIMNIMLVTVTERISEIGLRKALGATSGNIVFQFLIESAVLGLVGGLIGLVLAWLATLAISPYLKATIPPWDIVLGLGFSMLVGIIFGTYPAYNAGKMDPIEALRAE